jgi:release factor glutamine methyltransferase
MPGPEASAVAPWCSVGEAVQGLAACFAAAGVPAPRTDARLLVAAAAGLTRADLLARPERALTAETSARLREFARRRERREPVSRMLGTREFWGRPFRLSPATLDPRPDSETLIEAALQVVAQGGARDRELRILDIGTGSGCLLLTLLAELPGATGLGTDIGAEALAVAADNARALGVGQRVRFELARSLAGPTGPFDLVVCNPPYVPSAEIATLAPEVRDFDPRAALDGGPDGLDIYRELAPGLPRLAPGGVALFEVGAGQAGEVTQILRARAGFVEPPRIWRDLGGHERCVAVRIHPT